MPNVKRPTNRLVAQVMAALTVLTLLALIVAILAHPHGSLHSPRSAPDTSFSDSPCAEAATKLRLEDGPYDNHFYSDCHTAAHVIVTSPQSGSDLNVVKPRLLVAWPAGNSGVMARFAPENGPDGSLSIVLDQSSSGDAIQGISDSKRVGVSGTLTFNTDARLTVPILGSIRSIRDFVEGGNINQAFQNSFGFGLGSDGSASINRTWFDNVTTTTLAFTPLNGAKAIVLNREAAWTLTFGAGSYRFEASFNYPQLEQLSPPKVLNEASTGLISQDPDKSTSLSFLSYSNKLLAGTWRFLTYFGRDSMISLLLMQSVLSQDAIEAVIGAVLERIQRSTGTVCHEEVIGDYATWVNRQNGVNSIAPSCDYKMIDTDFFLPISMKSYFIDTEAGKKRSDAFFKQTATFLEDNKGLSYAALAQLTAEKIMRIASPFAGNQIKSNLIHLKDGESVGEWRDSNDGLGGGRIPYDVNTALVPAGLRAIASLSKAGFFPDHPEWSQDADRYAQIWEDETLRFFEITVPKDQAKSLVQDYVSSANLGVPTNVDQITGDVTYYGLALDGKLNTPVVPVMNTDDCFRHFLLDTTNQTQLSAYMSQTADHILKPFPVGLYSDVGLFVANPAYAGNKDFAGTFSRTAYHGTVVWSWQLAMMGAGLGRQLGRCSSSDVPDFCKDSTLHGKVLSAYNKLWETIDANGNQLSNELWSWKYDNGFKVEQLGALTSTESNIRQLWSLTFLAIKKQDFGKK